MQVGKKKCGGVQETIKASSKESLNPSLTSSSRLGSLQKLAKRNWLASSPRPQTIRSSRSDIFGRRRQRRRSLSDLESMSVDFVRLEPSFNPNYRCSYGPLVDAVLNKYKPNSSQKQIDYKPPVSEVHIFHMDRIYREKTEIDSLQHQQRLAVLKRTHWFYNITPTSASSVSLPRLTQLGKGQQSMQVASARTSQRVVVNRPQIVVDRPRSTSSRQPGTQQRLTYQRS